LVFSICANSRHTYIDIWWATYVASEDIFNSYDGSFTRTDAHLIQFLSTLFWTEGKRDKIMAENVTDKSQENNYSEVLVLCGDYHVPGITSHLEELGWEVHEERSKHPFSRITRLLFE
jgi:hypothetical protein